MDLIERICAAPSELDAVIYNSPRDSPGALFFASFGGTKRMTEQTKVSPRFFHLLNA